MQKTILKQNYENFAALSQEGLDKTYDSLASAWNNIALIMRNKSDLDTLSMDALYNNLKVYKSKIKSQSSSSSNSQNVAFVSLDNSSSTNETVNIARSISAASSKDQASTRSYADDVHKEDRKKLDLNGKDTVSFDRTKFECYDCHRRESLEARIVVHEKNEAVFEENIVCLKYDVQVKDISIKDLQKQLKNTLKEKDDMKFKLQKFETSFKDLTKMINSQISIVDKTSLGYDGQMNKSDLNDIHVNESAVLNNVVEDCGKYGNDSQVNDRFKKSEGYHAVPPPYTGNYMPPRADLSFVGLDSFVFKFKVCEIITSMPKLETNASKTSKDILEKLITVRSSAPIIDD
nr:hypothetical protein [Tanacetum cinerariifolium]